MSTWWDPLPSATGLEVLPSGVAPAWPDAAFADERAQLAYCPIGASEALAAAQALPLSILNTSTGPQLIAQFGSDHTKIPAFGASGQWRLSYTPVALRNLPFLTLSDGRIARLPATDTSPDVPRDENLQTLMAGILRRAAHDQARAGELLNQIIELGWLALDEAKETYDWGDGLAQGFQTQTVPRDRILAYRLLCAIGFSQKNAVAPNQLKQHFMAELARIKQSRDAEVFDGSFLNFDAGIEFE